MTKFYGPTQRPDSAPPHSNAIRRLREELRLGRPEFAELLDVNEHTLRVWEEDRSRPRTPATMRIIDVAHRNCFPMDVQDLHPPQPKKPTGPVSKKKVAKKKRRAYKK